MTTLFLYMSKMAEGTSSHTMAEGILFNVAASILTKLGSLAAQEIGLILELQDELQRLRDTVETVTAVLLDAEKQYQTSNEVRVWLDSLKDAAYDVDDLLDDISSETLKGQLKSGNVLTKKMQLFFSCSNELAYGLKMAHKIKDIRARLDGIAANRKFHLNPNLGEPAVVDHDRDTHSSPPNVVIGREDDKKEIMSLLLADHEENVAVIPIVGLGGLGKTTLAQIIYNDEMVKAQFELKAWVCVSDVFDIKSIVEKMVECIDGKKPKKNLEIETLKNQLCEKIKGKKYLFVLDDIWNEDREKWIRLNDLVVGGARGSRIIVTTRSMAVAEITGTLQPYKLKSLSEMESLDLFRKVAFKKGQAPNEVFDTLGKEIAIKLCGLPLAIRTIGSFLFTKRNESEWEDALSKLDPKINIIDTLKLSYNHLPSNFKYCFAYCSLFPKDYKYDVPTLINYWKAQGYIDAKTGGDEGFNCYKHLLQRSFFQEEEEDKSTGILMCKMHDFMHDLAMSVAGEEIKLVDGSSHGTIVTGKTRHISLQKIPKAQRKHLNPLLEQKKARTLIIINSELDDIEFNTIVDKMRCLRMLKLSRHRTMKVPRCIDRLKHLRELDLTNNPEIEMLPDSVARLHNLQVLILDFCTELRRLPKGMKKLANLIHLGLDGCDNLEEMPQGIGQLTSLEVLSQFCLSPGRISLLSDPAGGLDELHRLNKLTGILKIFLLQNVKKGALECGAANLKGKLHLRRLTLDWGEHQVEDVSREEESLEALQPHVNLLYLSLNYYGGARFPSWVSSLANMVKIEFYNCSNCKSLPSLEGLPSLQQLRVSNMEELEYMIDNSRITKRTSRSCFFPKLNKLSLSNCSNLKGWWRITPTTEELLHYQLPCLSELKIWSCFNLKGWMPQLPSLDTLVLFYISAGQLEEILKQAKTKSLRISQIEDLGSLPEEALQNAASLKFLEIHAMQFDENNVELTQRFRNLCLLKFLEFAYCWKLKSLPEWIQDLTSLETLEIRSCYALETLPAWMSSLTSLNRLQIFDCINLSERCESNQGEDWPFISHIPNIQVEYVTVQHNGSYQL